MTLYIDLVSLLEMDDGRMITPVLHRGRQLKKGGKFQSSRLLVAVFP